MASRIFRHYPATMSERAYWLAAGFIFGALAVLVFHQGALAMLHSAGIARSAAYAMQPAHPFGIPQIWSTAFWGGLWGVLLAAAVVRLDGARLVFAATLFGLVLPTLAAWFMVAAMKGQPLAAGFVPKAMAVGPIVNAAWGFGTGIGLAWLGRARGKRRVRRIL